MQNVRTMIGYFFFFLHITARSNVFCDLKKRKKLNQKTRPRNCYKSQEFLNSSYFFKCHGTSMKSANICRHFPPLADALWGLVRWHSDFLGTLHHREAQWEG